MAFAEGLEATCAELGVHSVGLVAKDTHGPIARVVAARDAERITTLTLTNHKTHANVPPPAV
jgi:hypothetical protein